MKKCVKCLQEKELTEFYKYSPTRGGYRHKCKKCYWEREFPRNCPSCKETKEKEDFPKGVSTYCKTCTVAKARKWQQDSGWNSKVRRYKKYGINKEEYERLLATQSGVCAICKEVDVGDSRYETFHIDHCHETGKVRGVLCAPCNRGLGQFKDRTDLLLKAAEYLENARA